MSSSRTVSWLAHFSTALVLAGVVQAQSLGGATIGGLVADDSDQPIPGVTITVRNGGGAAVEAVSNLEITDMAGRFRVGGLRPGGYVVEVTLDGFQPLSREIRLTADQTLELAFTLIPAFRETVEVVAEAFRTGEIAVLESRRQSAVVSDLISAEEIRRTPDGNAAAVVERLTGVTLMGDKFVFVRGLGERYSGTTINGATLSTTETEKRVVPLDLFPAKLLDTVSVVKTYTPDRPGDFGSAVVDMKTTDFPSSSTFRVSLGASWRSGTGEAFGRYAGGVDRLGRGGQRLPSIVPEQVLNRMSALNPSGFTPQELEQFGEAFVGSWAGAREGTASPGTDFSLTWGDTFGPIGLVFSAVSNSSADSTDEVQRFFGLDSGETLVARNDYEMITDRERSTTGMVGNVSIRLADGHHLSLNTLFTREGSAENRIQEGLNTNTGGDIRDYRARYQLEEVFSGRLAGDHGFRGPALGSALAWNVSRSKATSESDLRENLYREAAAGKYALQVGFSESGKTEFFDLDDQIDQAGVSYAIFGGASETGWFGSVKGGVDLIDRTRDFGARRFLFTTVNPFLFDLTLPPEQIFTPENIRPAGFELREVTGVNDAYDAEQTIEASYLMGDLTFGSWRIIGGARVERSEQGVVTFNPFDRTNPVESLIESTDVLPSMNLVYQYAPQTNLRIAWGRSLNRPEFREMSPFTFVEVAGGRSVAGNPDLTQATLDGFDVRWETFPSSGEVIALSAFYKRIDDPIEQIIQPTTELRTSFVNADLATLLGFELEFRRSLEILTPALRFWSVNLNYALIESEVEVGDHLLSVLTNSRRPLEGQSDQVGNLAVQFFRPDSGTMIRLLGSYTGDRLTDVGAFGLPDVYEQAFRSLDAVVSQRIGGWLQGLELKLAGSNLLDRRREFTQGAELFRRYDPGRTISLSIGYSPY
ncbi:MAG TPA: TonB-dependent receptor [Thermoanaerobaculia bacterium]|nr:TonB-dependent receptor [Thermoanaerobaculia bacterium]